MRTQVTCDFADEAARAIVENEDAKIGMVDCHRAGDRAFKDRFWFVSGDDEHLHRRGKEGRVLRRVRVRRSVIGAG